MCGCKPACAETVGSTCWKRHGAAFWNEAALRVATDWVTRPDLNRSTIVFPWTRVAAGGGEGGERCVRHDSQCTVGPVRTWRLLPHGGVVDVSIALTEIALKRCEERGGQRHHSTLRLRLEKIESFQRPRYAMSGLKIVCGVERGSAVGAPGWKQLGAGRPQVHTATATEERSMKSMHFIVAFQTKQTRNNH